MAGSNSTDRLQNPTILNAFKARFHYKYGKEHFFFIDLSVLKIEASAKQSKKINKTNKE